MHIQKAHIKQSYTKNKPPTEESETLKNPKRTDTEEFKTIWFFYLKLSDKTDLRFEASNMKVIKDQTNKNQIKLRLNTKFFGILVKLYDSNSRDQKIEPLATQNFFQFSKKNWDLGNYKTCSSRVQKTGSNWTERKHQQFVCIQSFAGFKSTLAQFGKTKETNCT